MGDKRSVVYYVNWAIYGRKHRPRDIPRDWLTHVLYSFANIKTDTGEVVLTDSWADAEIHWADYGDSWNQTGNNLFGNLKQLNILKRQNRNLKVLLSIGGWTYSANFAGPASTDGGRRTFASSAVQLLKDYGFDGLDIDWEFPKSDAEGQNYVQLLQECRHALDAYATTVPSRPHFELTVACPAGPANWAHMPLRAMDPYLDFWNLMAYDYAGSWDQVSGHQANLTASRPAPACTPFSSEAAVNYYVANGVNSSKLVLGMPCYGRAFTNTRGMGQAYSGVGDGSWEAGVYDYKALPLSGATETIDENAGASYSFDSGRGMIVSYDNVAMATRKANWIIQRGLGGGMWWESSGDRPGGVPGKSLIANVVQAFGGSRKLRYKANCLDYPQSKWDNVRSGNL